MPNRIPSDAEDRYYEFLAGAEEPGQEVVAMVEMLNAIERRLIDWKTKALNMGLDEDDVAAYRDILQALEIIGLSGMTLEKLYPEENA